MKKLAVINYQAVELYHSQGWSKNRLASYYNPCNVFDKVHIYAFQEPGITISDENGWYIDGRIYVQPFYRLNTLFDPIKRFQPDVIRCYECNYPFALFALGVAKTLNRPSYLSLHDSRKKPAVNLKDYTVITAYNKSVAENAAYILDRVVEIQPNGVDSEFFRPQLNRVPNIHDAYRILTIGRDDPVKNMDTMMLSTLLFSQQIDGTVYHQLIGPGTETMPIDSTIHKGTGPASEDRVRDAFQSSHCFLQTQLVPDIGVAHTEALMMGIPIIATARIPKEIGIHIPVEQAKHVNATVDALHEVFSTDYDAHVIRRWAVTHYSAGQTQQQEAKRYRQLCL